MKDERKTDIPVEKGQVALFTKEKTIISGECTYTAKRFGNDVLIEIWMRKDGILSTKAGRKKHEKV